jgi:hypothetical protein
LVVPMLSNSGSPIHHEVTKNTKKNATGQASFSCPTESSGR